MAEFMCVHIIILFVCLTKVKDHFLKTFQTHLPSFVLSLFLNQRFSSPIAVFIHQNISVLLNESYFINLTYFLEIRLHSIMLEIKLPDEQPMLL